MNSKVLTPRFIFIAVLILVASMMRLIPHLPNFTPVAAIALFGGAYFTKKAYAFILPFAVLLLSDMILGFHSYMFAVYISFALTVGLGILMSKKVNIATVLGGAIGSAILFFIVTNFAVWVMTPQYTKDFAGLVNCYTMAVPFFNNGILGDLFYTTVLFGSFYLARLRFPILAKA